MLSFIFAFVLRHATPEKCMDSPSRAWMLLKWVSSLWCRLARMMGCWAQTLLPWLQEGVAFAERCMVGLSRYCRDGWLIKAECTQAVKS